MVIENKIVGIYIKHTLWKMQETCHEIVEKLRFMALATLFFIGKLQMHLVGLEPSISCNPAKHTFFLCNALRPSYEIPQKKKKKSE